MNKENLKIKIRGWRFFLLLLILVVANVIYAPGEKALASVDNKLYHINLDKITIAKGYTVSAFADNLKLSLVPGVLNEATRVEIQEINEGMEMPWQLDRISRIYQFEFRNKDAYDNHKPFYIQFSYDQDSAGYKQVFFYDKNYASWRPLPTKDFPQEKFVRSLIHLPFARIAVFVNPDVLTIGRASWYAYRGGNFAASPDFPKGSRLRVYNIANNKFVDVEINDYGPDRGLHPDRVVDLDKIAFKKIASLGAGLADVRVEPLYIAPEQGRILGISATGARAKPIINAKSAIVVNEQSGKVLFSKNATTTLPIASLTKLVAIKVFLDTRPSLDKVVSYNLQDEEYNYEHVDYKWEVARLKVKEGDTLTIEDLLYAALVGSANNAVETLVRVSGLARDDFIKKMNELVASWGAVATNFIEPSGLSPQNVSSAADYAIITKKIFTHPIIQKASTMPEYKFYTINTKEQHRLKNTNQLIKTNKYNITGSKTGYLDEAGYCLVTRVKLGNNQLIIITLGAESRDLSFSETDELIRYGIRDLRF